MVTIIIPIYNTEKYLDKCLESVRNQTYEDIEIVMIDDGSTDKSNDIAKKYVDVDRRFKLISQKNKGVSAARNKGLDISKGDYILFVDSDDWIEPHMVEILVRDINKYKVNIVCCQSDRDKIFTGTESKLWDKDLAIRKFLVHKEINGSLVNKLFKKILIGKTRFSESIKYGEDALFLWENLLNVSSIFIIPDILYHVTLHDDSASGGGNYKPIRRDCIKVWSKISEDAENISRELGSIARAQLGNMAFFSLYGMGYYSYKDKAHQQEYIAVLRNTIKDLTKSNFISIQEKVFSRVFLFNAQLGMILVRLKRLVRR